MTACDQKGLSLSPDFEILHDILHGSQFSIQPASLGGDAVQLPPEVGDVGFEEGLQALPHSPGTLLLQEAPFGLQDLVLLLQEPHLPSNRKRTSGSSLQPTPVLVDFPRNKVARDLPVPPFGLHFACYNSSVLTPCG